MKNGTLRGACVGAAALVVASGVASGVSVTRVALLTGSQETPANASPGKGAGLFEINTQANTCSYRIVFYGMMGAENNAHIHGPAGPGVPAGVVHPLPLGQVKVGVWNYPENMEAALLGGQLYVNIHSTVFGGGELRGQIVTHVAFMDGVQETPAVVTAGTGFGLFMMDTTADTLSYYISYGGLTGVENNAHIHGYSRHSIASGVAHPLVVGVNPKVGVWNYPAANEQQIIDGLTYVNIHTTFAGGGEIRGQIVASVNPMDGMQEAPAGVAATTTGFGLVSIDTAVDGLGFDVMRGVFTTAETLNHIHGYSAAGANSGVVFTLPGVGTQRKFGSWTYPAAQETNIYVNEMTYFNCHTAMFGSGEIRGQIRFPSLTKQIHCPADYDDGSGTGTIDNAVDISDLLYYLGLFDAGDLAADLDDGSGTGTKDGGVDISDLLYYLGRFDAGC